MKAQIRTVPKTVPRRVITIKNHAKAGVVALDHVIDHVTDPEIDTAAIVVEVNKCFV